MNTVTHMEFGEFYDNPMESSNIKGFNRISIQKHGISFDEISKIVSKYKTYDIIE